MNPFSNVVRTTLRTEWTFKFTESELRDAAEKKVKHHKGRLENWTEEHTKTKDAYVKSVQDAAKRATEKETQDAEELGKLTDQWLEAEMAGAPQASTLRIAANNAYGGPKRMEIIGDTDLYEDLQKALQKVNEHRRKVEEFTRWVTLLPERKGDEKQYFTRELTYEDAKYFGL